MVWRSLMKILKKKNKILKKLRLWTYRFTKKLRKFLKIFRFIYDSGHGWGKVVQFTFHDMRVLKMNYIKFKFGDLEILERKLLKIIWSEGLLTKIVAFKTTRTFNYNNLHLYPWKSLKIVFKNPFTNSCLGNNITLVVL